MATGSRSNRQIPCSLGGVDGVLDLSIRFSRVCRWFGKHPACHTSVISLLSCECCHAGTDLDRPKGIISLANLKCRLPKKKRTN